MNRFPFHPVAVFLLVAFAVPAVLFAIPSRAEAGGVSCLSGIIGGLVGSTAQTTTNVPVNSNIENKTTSTSAGANIGKCVESTILIPLGRVAISTALKAITMDTIHWIQDNGQGQASYIKNLPKDLQGIGDVAAGVLISQVAQGALNSPFGSAISSALRTVYDTESSMAGFYAADQCTLAQYSANANAFLSGDWSQGGITAWLALTTEDQNNPYTLYNSVLSRMGSNVGTAQAVRLNDITISGGYLSWCAPDTFTTEPPPTAGNCSVLGQPDAGQLDAQGNCVAIGTQANPQAAGNQPPSCTNADGTLGTITTPGSTIKSYVDNTLGTGIGQLVNAQDIDSSIAAILSALSTKIMNETIYKPGGLFGSSQSSGNAIASPLPVTQNVFGDVCGSALSDSQTISGNMSDYVTAAQAVLEAADEASSSIQDYIDAEPAFVAEVNAIDPASAGKTDCYALQAATTTALSDAKIALSQAQKLLSSDSSIADAIDTASSSIASASSTQSLAIKVQEECAPNATTTDPQVLSSDVSALTTSGLGTLDIMSMENDATATGKATATPFPDGTASLSVSGGTTLDQMNLLKTIADSLISSWNAEISKAQNSCLSASD